MGVRDIPNISNYASLHLQPVRGLAVTVEVLDKDLRQLDTIQGIATGGNISVSNSSLIRRTGSLSFTLFDYLLPQKQSLLWITNRIRVYAGLQDLTSSEGQYTHFCLGTFYITEPSVSISNDNRSISIELQDNMMRWEQEELENKLVIEAGAPLHSAVQSIMRSFGEWNVLVDFTDLTIPYKLEFNEGESLVNILTQLRDLYMDWECFYDVDGTFIFRKMQIQRPDGEPVAWSFKGSADLITSFKESFAYSGVKNKVVVVGAMNERSGITPKAEAKIANVESPFHENEIGVKKTVITENSYGTIQQCDSRARYELFKMSNFQEKIDISSLPIYFLDGNDIIEVMSSNGKLSKYVIESIGFGLGIGDEMSISAYKLYYDNADDIESSLEGVREIANRVIDGIKNKGWLSLSEQRIYDYYGLAGNGNKLFIEFEKGARYGTTAYVTGYLNETRQTLTIDVADFDSSIDSDSGDTGAGKAEYSDRILGHEIVHAVMNDAFTVNKTRLMPAWFKEGASEFIHGADERLKLSIVENGVISDAKLDNLVDMAVKMLKDDYWDGKSDSYSAGYVIMKYLDKKLVGKKNMKTLMNSIRLSTKSGSIALKESIVENTSFSTYNEFVLDVQGNLKEFITTKITLNLDGDEVDTGSIGGSDHRGTSPLNAEDVFDNSKAEVGVMLKNFEVIINMP